MSHGFEQQFDEGTEHRPSPTIADQPRVAAKARGRRRCSGTAPTSEAQSSPIRVALAPAAQLLEVVACVDDTAGERVRTALVDAPHQIDRARGGAGIEHRVDAVALAWEARGMASGGASDDWLVAGGTDPDEIVGRYDDWATTYDDDLRAWTYTAPRVVAETVMTRAPDARSVLDAGCGTGLVGRALRDAGFAGELHGRDLSEASLRVAASSGAYTSLASADLQQPLAEADDSVDVVVCVGVMTYVPDVEGAWREFARIARPGGLVVVTQREDLWGPRDCQGVIDRLSDDGTWELLALDGPAPYLPENPDGMASVGVYYLTAQVR